MLEPKVIVDATKEPITVAEFQAHARVDTLTSVETDLIEDIYIPAARRRIEEWTGRTIHQKTLEIVLDRWPCDRDIDLPRATPLISITSVILKDSNENTSTWSSSYYLADTDEIPGELALRYGQQWPIFTPSPASPIRIRYVAGIATTSPVTEADARIKELCCLLVAGAWENRESEQFSNTQIGSMVENIRVKQLVDLLRVEYGV